MGIDYSDPVTKKDIEAEEEYSKEGMNNFTEFYYRISYQGAPAPLVEEMAVIANLYKQINERLKNIRPCFP